MNNTSPERSAVMRAVRGKNTKPELAVRKMLRGLAPGYRLHRADVPGNPDICWLGARRAIFAHGCFWHGHDCARGARTPRTNAAYWRAKIARNVARDAMHRAALKRAGWTSLVIWECELRAPERVARRLERFTRPLRP